MTDGENVSMLWGVAMSLRRLAWSGLVLAAPLLAACDPVDDGPPPASPQNSYVPPPPPPGDGAGEAVDPNAAGNPDGMYASGEYRIGEDTDAYDDSDPSALTDFRQALDSHGAWTDDPTYGTIWTPSPAEVGPDFTPYTTAGHWGYDTDYVWVSDYDWGWAPFHYGRWVYIDGRGWAWIPGREYRGAWVAWGVDDGYGYVGWYPMAPSFFWFGGVGVAYSFTIGPRWSYCGRGDVFSPVVGSRVVRGPAAVSIAGRVHAVASVNGVAGHGPEPGKLGFAAAQIPRASTLASPGLARAQQFARPSTATALGARAPSRAPTAAAMGGAGRPPLTGGYGSSVMSGAHAGSPGFAPQGHAPPIVQVPPRKRPTSEPSVVPHAGHGGSWHGGGGAGHSGGSHGGGGHHR